MPTKIQEYLKKTCNQNVNQYKINAPNPKRALINKATSNSAMG